MSDIVDKAKGQANLLVSAYHKPMRVLDCQGMSAFMKAPSDFPPDNPMTASGEKVMGSMMKEYGGKKGRRVFYASINKGKPGSSKWHGKKK